jgi:hypothetical protein
MSKNIITFTVVGAVDSKRGIPVSDLADLIEETIQEGLERCVGLENMIMIRCCLDSSMGNNFQQSEINRGYTIVRSNDGHATGII